MHLRTKDLQEAEVVGIVFGLEVDQDLCACSSAKK
jgi:hypothetical protein